MFGPVLFTEGFGEMRTIRVLREDVSQIIPRDAINNWQDGEEPANIEISTYMGDQINLTYHNAYRCWHKPQQLRLLNVTEDQGHERHSPLS